MKKAKKAAAKKKPAKAAPRNARRARKSAKARKPSRGKTGAAAGQKSKGLTDTQKKQFRDMLLSMRERLQGQITALKGDSLVRDDDVNNGEDGSDFFERQFALNIVSSERDAVLEIDEALRRIDEGSYGICEACNGPIEIERLKALPFVRNCIQCQSQSENGKVRFRPMLAPEEI